MDDWERVRTALRDHGVAGADDLGLFVNNREYVRPSGFDERAAMPVLVALLPTLTDAGTVETVARHLRRPWARSAAFPALLDAFRRWAVRDESATTAWALGDSLANAARPDDLPVLLDVVRNSGYGRGRQMVVHALWRFRSSDEVAPALVGLLGDPDVALHAMGALRRTVGPEATLPHLRAAAQRHQGNLIGPIAIGEIRKAEKALSRGQRVE
jgi:hypothetical protein